MQIKVFFSLFAWYQSIIQKQHNVRQIDRYIDIDRQIDRQVKIDRETGRDRDTKTGVDRQTERKKIFLLKFLDPK